MAGVRGEINTTDLIADIGIIVLAYSLSCVIEL
jgi:hypothetical protein